MAVESATNCWAESQVNFMTACANSDRLREIIGASDVAAATSKIFGQSIGDPKTGRTYTKDEILELGGHAQVYSSDDAPYGWTNAGNGFRKKFGTMIVYIDRLVTEKVKNDEDSPLEMERWMENRVADAMDQIDDYLRENSGPRVKDAFVSAGPGTNNRDEWSQIGIWQGIELTFSWGYE